MLVVHTDDRLPCRIAFPTIERTKISICDSLMLALFRTKRGNRHAHFFIKREVIRGDLEFFSGDSADFFHELLFSPLPTVGGD